MKISSYTVNKVIAGLARFFSTVMSPLLMPTYGVFLALWVSVLCILPFGTRLTVMVVIFGITCILPMILIGVLHNLKVIKDKKLENPRERFIPYVFSVLCYIGAALYLNNTHAPMWFSMFLFGAAGACLVSFVVNIWWKISAHMAGVGGVLAFLYEVQSMNLGAFNLFWVICFAVFFAGVLGSSRLILRRHSFLQVLAGFINGYLWVYLAVSIFG
jgi:membrane-associated phospholipid phosphatase